MCGCLVGGLGELAAQPLAGPAPVRVGGNIRPPAKIRDVPLVYFQIAQSARVAGIVILEITIGVDGAVTGARVLRGVPLLNDAALDAPDAAERHARAGHRDRHCELLFE